MRYIHTASKHRWCESLFRLSRTILAIRLAGSIMCQIMRLYTGSHLNHKMSALITLRAPDNSLDIIWNINLKTSQNNLAFRFARFQKLMGFAKIRGINLAEVITDSGFDITIVDHR